MSDGNTARRIAGFALILLLASASAAWGVIIRGGDGSGNTSAPADDPGWGNVGQRGDCGAVYIANGWVLTAGHVEPGPVVLGGVRYEMVPDSWRRISDPSRAGQSTDLGLFQIVGQPTGMRDLIISPQPPPTGMTVVAIGYGRNRATQPTTWYVDLHAQPNVWQESLFPEGRTIRKGFKYAAGQTKRWGKGNVNRVCPDQDYGQGPTCVIETMFHAQGGCDDDEMQLATKDSGGALFRKLNGNWVLAGILATKATSAGQPDETAVFGNLSYAVDLSAYADEIKITVYGPDNPAEAILPFLFPAVGVVACVVLLDFLWRRHRRKKSEKDWAGFED